MTRYQDDFYDAINGEWQQTAEIPADKSQTGGFVDLDQEIEDLMLATTDKWLAGEEVPEDAILENFVKYHRLVRDFDKREADGITPVLPLLKEFQELETFADFTAKLAEFELAKKPNFLPFGVSPDFMDARINVLWASAPSTILPDTTYYAEEHPQREELLTLWKESSANLLKAYDFSDEEIEDL
ncbi:Neutral endopeptidase O [Streptococcus pneumoniae]|nr:Neutral endopeptidase O [Streptococcus pneumoniae]